MMAHSVLLKSIATLSFKEVLVFPTSAVRAIINSSLHRSMLKTHLESRLKTSVATLLMMITGRIVVVILSVAMSE